MMLILVLHEGPMYSPACIVFCIDAEPGTRGFSRVTAMIRYGVEITHSINWQSNESLQREGKRAGAGRTGRASRGGERNSLAKITQHSHKLSGRRHGRGGFDSTLFCYVLC